MEIVELLIKGRRITEKMTNIVHGIRLKERITYQKQNRLTNCVSSRCVEIAGSIAFTNAELPLPKYQITLLLFAEGR